MRQREEGQTDYLWLCPNCVRITVILPLKENTRKPGAGRIVVLQQRMEKCEKGKQKYTRVFQKQVLQTAVL